MRCDVKSAHAQRFWVSQLERRRRSPPLEIFKMQSPSEPTRQRSHPESLARALRTYVGKRLPAREQQETNSCHGLPAGHLHGWLSCASNVCPAGSLGRPFWDSSPLMTPIFITWTIPGHFYLVRAVPGAVPTAAASMDGSDGRPDGIPGVGKGLRREHILTKHIDRP